LALYFNADELPHRSKECKKESQVDQAGGVFLFRANKSLYDMQCMMDLNGATDLVIDLIMAEPSPNIFLESIQLAIALLVGGNGAVQVTGSFKIFYWFVVCLFPLFEAFFLYLARKIEIK